MFSSKFALRFRPLSSLPLVRSPAPSFQAKKALVNGEISTISSSDFKGTYWILMFYPLDLYISFTRHTVIYILGIQIDTKYGDIDNHFYSIAHSSVLRSCVLLVTGLESLIRLAARSSPRRLILNMPILRGHASAERTEALDQSVFL